MTWTFTNAIRHGVVAVTVNAEDDSIEDEEERRKQRKSWTWGYPMFTGQTAAKFKAAVRKEVRAHIDHLNASVAETDISDAYSDL